MQRCLQQRLRLVTAESCTGGLLAGALTSLAGSSQIFDRGYVCYSNQSKSQLLGVPDDLIRTHGAVSQAVAEAMAAGALERAQGMAQLSIAVTGVAGPDSSEHKPVGRVHIALAGQGQPALHRQFQFPGSSRGEIRQEAVLAALQMATETVSALPPIRH